MRSTPARTQPQRCALSTPPTKRSAYGWHRYVDLIGTKRGLAEALHSGDTTFAGLHAYVAERLEPVVAALLADAVAADEIAAKVEVGELLIALSLLCQPVPAADLDLDYHRRMATILIEGLRPGPD